MNCNIILTFLVASGLSVIAMPEAAHKQFRSSIVQRDQLEKALQALVEQSNEETPTNEIDNVEEVKAACRCCKTLFNPICCIICESGSRANDQPEEGQVISSMEAPSSTKALVAEEPPVENCVCTLNLREGKKTCFPSGCEQPQCSCITIYIRDVPRKICVPDGCGQTASATKALVAEEPPVENCVCTLNLREGKKTCLPPGCDQPQCSCITVYVRDVPKKICIPDGCGQTASTTKALVAAEPPSENCVCTLNLRGGKPICFPPGCDQPQCSCTTIYTRDVPREICVPDGCKPLN